MKTTRNFFRIILLAILTVSCSDKDDSESNNSVFGTIQLSGPDTASVGNSLVVGNIDEDAFNTTGTSSSVVLLDENTTIVDDELVLTDFTNAFAIVAAEFDTDDNAAADKVISMTILSNGEEFRYGCTTIPTGGTNITDCGTGFSVDKVAKIVVFDNTTVLNLDNGTILTMDGTINYN